MSTAQTGVLLINLGTPRSPGTADVRRFLAEFLSDPRVLDMPAPLRWLLLHTVILPFRPRRSGRAYAKIWLPEGSPLLVHSLALRDALARRLGPSHTVELGMRYGEPSLRSALAKLVAARVDRLVALPLFPQHSEAATGSAVAKLVEEHARLPSPPPLVVRPAFHADPGFVAAVAAVAAPALDAFRPDFALFSYHGLPEGQIRAGDPTGAHCLSDDDCCAALGGPNLNCYRAQCFATTRALAAALELGEEGHATAFQSRLGPVAWIRPYTDWLLPELSQRGVKRLAVLCPAFTADCLETVEEIGIRARDQWLSVGGEELLLVPSLNAHPRWVEAVAELVSGDQEPDRSPTASSGRGHFNGGADA